MGNILLKVEISLGSFGFEVNQGIIVHIAAQMKAVIPIQSHCDAIVTIPAYFCGKHLVIPFFFRRLSRGDGQLPMFVVITNELPLAGSKKPKAYGEIGHHGIHFNGFQDLD